MRQSAQIIAHMHSHQHQRPLFWLYNPWLALPYLMVPAVGRVFHATENYFDFDDIPENLLSLERYCVEACDLVVCCSDGVARGLADHTRRRDFTVLSNGCEYLKYSRPVAPCGAWPAHIEDWLRAERRMAVFAGNINLRLDFGLIGRAAAQNPEIGFILAGPMSLDSLSARQRRECNALLHRSNVRVLGRLPPQDLPALYARCDLGILPYRIDMPMLVENGFPLKTLEMAAAGLPIVSTRMKPLLSLREVVAVVGSPEAFCLAVGSHSRRTRLPADREAVERVCRAHDYDVLFARMILELAGRLGDGPARPGNLADFAAGIGLEAYRSSVAHFDDAPRRAAVTSSSLSSSGSSRRMSTTLSSKLAAPLRRRTGLLLRRIPFPLRRLVPVSGRRLAQRWVGQIDDSRP